MRKRYRFQTRSADSHGADFWDQEWWAGADIRNTWNLTYDPLVPLFDRFLPSEGLILEAGCGTGKFVAHYRQRGYDIQGLDFAQRTLLRVKDVDPTLPLVAGDVLSLPYRDGSLACIISLGVVEHFEEGPGRALHEAARVLQPEGLLLITVPYLNQKRVLEDRLYGRALRQRGQRSEREANHTYEVTLSFSEVGHPEFFEYQFSKHEIASHLKAAGLIPFYTRGVLLGCGLAYDTPLGRIVGMNGGGAARENGVGSTRLAATGARPSRKSPIREWGKRCLVREDYSLLAARPILVPLSVFFSHMLFLACRKEAP